MVMQRAPARTMKALNDSAPSEPIYEWPGKPFWASGDTSICIADATKFAEVATIAEAFRIADQWVR